MSRGDIYTMPTQRVQEVARQKGWTSAMEIVRAARVATSTAYQIWNDANYVPSVQVLTKIAQALGVSWTELVVEDLPSDAPEQPKNGK